MKLSTILRGVFSPPNSWFGGNSKIYFGYGKIYQFEGKAAIK